jgi:hypothetical protein
MGEPLALGLPIWAWILAAGVLALGFVVIYRTMPFGQFQTGRFTSLGSTPVEIALSPLLRPGAFWGNVFRPRAICFILALTVPLGLFNLVRGWRLLLGAALPLGVLVAWDYPPATSIAFQYHTMALPVLFAAAISGAARHRGAASGVERLWSGGIRALAASFVASLALGTMLWSSPTLTDMIFTTYPGDAPGESVFNDRRAGSAGNAVLDDIVARVGHEDAHVLASGRILAHLIMVKRLEPVGTARDRWNVFAQQAGPGRTAVELFDWIVLDMRERFYQSKADMQFVAAAAAQAGFTLVQSDHDVLVYRAPLNRD